MAKIKIDTHTLTHSHRNATQKHKSTTIKKLEKKRTNERTNGSNRNESNEQVSNKADNNKH